jgi:hypothetical protein
MVQCRSEREREREEDTVQRILSESMPKYMAEKAALFPALLFFDLGVLLSIHIYLFVPLRFPNPLSSPPAAFVYFMNLSMAYDI